MVQGYKMVNSIPDWELFLWDDFHDVPATKVTLYDDGVGYWAARQNPANGMGAGIDHGESDGTGYSADMGERFRYW